ncbi:MAG: flagellar hook-basal body complex protein FliE [Hydrogenophilaceae bacterium]|nr:flagellar hook-basal body complex protein FliE [Hydrogenophilaceae bacterium]
MNNPGIEQMVSQLRAVAAQAGQSPSAAEAGGQDFTALLKAALDQVSSAQQDAKQLSQQFELGDPNTSLQDVVLSLQKASVSFQTMVQVRNKLVSAYQEIMNMQV